MQPDPQQPRPAATLAIVRDGPDGPEVLLTVRPVGMRFMGGATVFPGGAVAPADADPRWERASRLDRPQAAAALADGDESGALAAFVCALREACEEVGLLLVHGHARPERGAELTADRWLERCLDLGVELATDALVPSGRWVTPRGAPVRFDARFFMARAPMNWEPDPDPAEVASWRWATARTALDELAAGAVVMAPPTVEMLQRIAAHADVDSLLARRSPEMEVHRLSPLVCVLRAPNPGKLTGPGTNTYIVGTGPTIVIDPAVDDDRYLDALCRVAGSVEAILVTHRHSDHVEGVPALVRRTGAPVYAWGGQPVENAQVTSLHDGEVVACPGAALTALYTPGHSSDHLCFVLEGAASLFAGDTILGEGTSVIAPPDGSMKAYLDSLRRLEDLHITRIYPGHFAPLDGGRDVVAGYIAHRKARERAVIAACGRDLRTLDEIVAMAYAGTPEPLLAIARFSAQAHLEMLEEQGRVKRIGDRWSIEAFDTSGHTESG